MEARNQFFKELTPAQKNKKDAAQLLEYIDKAEYDKIESMWKQNPRLMFAEVKDTNGKLTTPLKAALCRLDTWTWRPFYEWVQHQNPELLQEFYKQTAEQNTHINLQRLFKAYADFNNRCENMSTSYINWQDTVQEDPKMRGLSLDDLAMSLSNEQRYVMPWHMLREMCRDRSKHGSWLNAGLDENTPPKGDRIYSEHVLEMIMLDSNEFNHHGWNGSGKGKGVILCGRDAPSLWVRCDANNAYVKREGRQLAAKVDAAVLHGLYEARKAEFVRIFTLAHNEIHKNDWHASIPK